MSNTEMKEYRGVEVEVATIKGPCYVAHVDRENGITIHDANDEEAWCLNREEFLRNSKHISRNRTYHEIFGRVVEQIKEGFVEDFLFFPKTGEVTWHRTNTAVGMLCDSFRCAFK